MKATMTPSISNRAPRPQALPRGLVLLLAFSLAGCGLFNPANPENPSISGGIPLPGLTSDPESALVSLQIGLETRSIDFYRHALAESTAISDAEFHAFFDPQDLAEYQTQTGHQPPSDWTSSQEKTFFSSFTSLVPIAYTVVFTPDVDRPDQRGDQTTLFYRHYRIFAGQAPEAIGLMDLVLRRVGVNQEWKIVQWVDRRDTVAAGVKTMGLQRLYLAGG
jgi:hypothetical protein